MKKAKGYTPHPHQLARAMNISARAHRVIGLLLSYTKPGSRKPAFPSWRHLREVTGFGRDRLSSAIRELESLRMLRVERSRTRSRYFILSEEEWQLKAYEADSKVVLNQDHGSPETGPTLVPNQDTIKNKRLRLTDLDGREDTTTQNSPPSFAGVESPVGQMGDKAPVIVSRADSPASDEVVTQVRTLRAYRPETEDERKKRDYAEVEQLAADPDYIEIFGSSEKVRAHFNKERGTENDHQDDGAATAKDGHGEAKQ